MRASRRIIGDNICLFVGTREGKSCNKLAFSRKCFVSASVPLTKAVEPRIENFRASGLETLLEVVKQHFLVTVIWGGVRDEARKIACLASMKHQSSVESTPPY